MTDPWIQRFDEHEREDERDQRRRRFERADRLTEQASLEPWQARIDPDALQPDLGPLPSLAYQGTPPVRPTVGFWRRPARALGWAAVIVLALILAAALALAIFMAAAWVLDG